MPNTLLCLRCPAKCCRYLALQIDKPTKAADFEHVRWYLMHDDLFVFVESDKWYLHLYTRCGKLMEDNRCGHYDLRPTICRSYNTDDCDFTGTDYEWSHTFRTVADLDEFVHRKLGTAYKPGRTKDLSKQTVIRELPVPIDAPTDGESLDDLRWYVLHDRIRLRLDGQRWRLLYKSRVLAEPELPPGQGYMNEPDAGDRGVLFFDDDAPLVEYVERVLSLRSPTYHPQPSRVLPLPTANIKVGAGHGVECGSL